MNRPVRRALRAVALVGLAALVVEGALVGGFEALAPRARPNPRGELAPPSSGAVTLIGICDVHARPGVLNAAFADAAARGAAAVLIGGDLVNKNSDFEYRFGALLLALEPPIPSILAIGNHEGFDRSAHFSRERFERFFGPTVSWFMTRGVLVVSIDTADEYSFSEEQARAADALLAAERARAREAVILTHVMPLFARPSIDKRGFVKHLDEPDSERLRALCSKHRVALVLGGHFHGYAEEQRGDTLYVMAGGGGGALDGPTESHHYVRFTLGDGPIRHEVVPVSGVHGVEWLLYLALRNRVAILGALAAATASSALLLRATRSAVPA